MTDFTDRFQLRKSVSRLNTCKYHEIMNMFRKNVVKTVLYRLPLCNYTYVTEFLTNQL